MTKVLAKAGESTKDLDGALKRLGNTPIGVEATRSAKNLEDTLKRVTDQQQKLGQQASFAAQGIEKLGGPARLTTDQLNQMNVTIQKGLEAFRALGQEAPADLQRVAAAVKAQQQALEGSGSAITKITNLQGALTSQLAAYAGPAAIGFAIKQTLDYADTLTKMSDRTGIGVVALQRLEAIAKPSGNSIEEVANAVNKFQKNLAEGDSAATGAIGRLGLSFSKLKDLNPDEQFIAIAKAIQGIKDPAEQTLIAVQLFGRGGAEILPTLKAKVDELADSTVKMSAESVKALDDLGDKFGQLKTSALNSLGELVAEASHIIDVYKNLPGAISKAIEDIRKGRETKIPFEGAARTAAGLLGINGVDQLFDTVNGQASPGIPKATGPTSDRNLQATLPSNLEAITAGLTASAQALIDVNLKQKAVADQLGLSLEEYQKKVGEVDAKIRLLTTTSSGLNDAQKIQATSLASLGLAEDDIALKLGTSAKAIKDYFDSVKAGASAEVEFLKQLDAQAKLNHDAEDATIALSLAIREHLLPNTVALKDQLAAVGRQTVIFSGENEAAALHLEKLGKDVENLGQKVFASNSKVKDATNGFKAFSATLSGLSNDFTQLAQISDGTFSNMAKDIGLAIKAGDQLGKALSFMSDVGSGKQAGGWSAANLASLAAGWVGVAVAIYSVVQAISEAKKAAAEAAQALARAEEASKAFGSTSGFSADLNQSIEQTNTRLDEMALAFSRAGNEAKLADLFGTTTNTSAAVIFMNGEINRTADYYGRLHDLAASLNLSKEITELGGAAHLTSDQLLIVQHHFENLFDLIKVGGAIGVTAISAMDDAMQQFADEANKSGGFVSDTFLQVAKDAEKAGVALDKVKAFQQAQTSRAATGLTTLFGGLSASAEASGKPGGVTPASFEQAQGLGNAVAGTFASAVAGGATLRDALKSIQGPLDELNKGLKNTAFNGGSAFIGLTALSDIAANKVQGPLLDAIDGAKQAIIGMGNAGYLTQSSFGALALAATQAYQGIIADGGDANAAAMAMQPTLQTLWEAEQKFGYTTDEATQALIDQGVANGTIGEQMKSTNDKILDVLVAIGKAFGVTIPDGIDTAAKHMKGVGSASEEMAKEVKIQADEAAKALTGIKAPTLTIKVGFDDGGGYQDHRPLDPTLGGYGSTGGYVTASGIQHFAGGGRVLPFWSRGSDTVPAMLTPGEMVLTAAQQKNIAASVGGVTVENHFHGTLIDRASVTRFLNEYAWPELPGALNRDRNGERKAIKKAAA